MKLINTLTGRLEEFVPQGDPVKMYVCGVTTYGPAHVGHAFSYVFFDVLRRYLAYKGYRVLHVQNFTDIDDNVIRRASEEGISPQGLSDRYIREFFEDMDALNVQRAHRYPRATEEVPNIVKAIAKLVEGCRAYPAGGDVYYRVERAPGYGKLSHRTLEGMMAGTRVEVSPLKEHYMDFALWKGSKPGEPAWDSPWGPGRPGWHIECSVMAMEHLGEEVDIHGGGQDLIFPHHENELAQSEALLGKGPFVRYWLHNGLLQLGGDKMSKSLGNLVTLREALERHHPDALRLFFLDAHYRSPLAYSEEGVEGMERAAERLRNAAGSSDLPGHSSDEGLDPTPFRKRFEEAMENDMNTPQALGALFDLAREINRFSEQGRDAATFRRLLRELASLLGLTLRGKSVDLAAKPLIQLLIETREELRKARQWELADRIRARLAELDVVLEDKPQGTIWKAGRRPLLPEQEGD